MTSQYDDIIAISDDQKRKCSTGNWFKINNPSKQYPEEYVLLMKILFLAIQLLPATVNMFGNETG